MKILKVKNYEEMSKRASIILASQVIIKNDSVLGLATGYTPLGMYKELVKLYNDKIVDFKNVITFNLDEYKGLSKQDNKSYYYYMNENFFKYVNINSNNINIPDGMAKDEKKECEKYDELLKKVGVIDLQILGIGNNGHIGFNEPGIDFGKTTHCVKLDESTIKANSRFFEIENDVPHYAYSMGIKSIMLSKKIVLMASGKEKADALYNTFFNEISNKTPSSILRLHKDVTIIADEDALYKLNGKI